MWQSPGSNQDLLQRYGCLDDIYKAMQSKDLSEIVVIALEVLNKTGTLPLVKLEKKSEAVSSEFRMQGNQAYSVKKYREALILYNKALKYAPKESKVMKLAYSNRSALFMTIKAFPACLNDIDTVFEMDCPPEIHSKLQQRHMEATIGMRLSNSYWLSIPASANAYFKFLYEPTNPQVSCATKHVGVIMEDSSPKIVAATDVKVGAVLAVETAFVSNLVPDNLNIACYYCHRLDYNLMPCDGCCQVLFCDEMCMDDCMKQYHNIECKIMDLLNSLECNESLKLAVKAAIKMKLSCVSWESLIEASKIYGANRKKKSSIGQIYNENFLFSLLNWEDNRHFIHGKMYNSSFIIAAIIHYLGLIPGFLPDFSGRVEAIKCLGRIMMYLTLFSTPTVLVDVASINDTPEIVNHDIYNFGLFSFVGKLKNSCMPNVLSVGLNNKVGLVALQPIARGTEITVAYMGHWLDTTEDSSKRPNTMFMLYATVCNCIICSGEWKRKTSTLTPAQKSCYNKLKIREVDYYNVPKAFKNLSRALAFLHDVPFSEEYKNVYVLFRKCIALFQHVNSENNVMERLSS